MKKYINYSSPWAFIITLSLMSIMLSLVNKIKLYESSNFSSWWSITISLILLLMTVYLWIRDSTREAELGMNNNDMNLNIKLATILFLISEAFFFISFFWMFLYSSLAPDLGYWPPVNLWNPSFIGAPSLNTILLVSSSATVTLSHYEANLDKTYSFEWLIITLIFSVSFITIQYMEYVSLPFNFSSGVGGAIFFISTGFHGLHVIIGTFALLISLLLLKSGYLTKHSMLGYELSIWYWHFVDGIWLMLYVIFYCWGS